MTIKNKVLTLILLPIFLWALLFLFFCFFTYDIGHAKVADDKVDAVAVFTGSHSRVLFAFELFSKIRPKKLLISGVNSKTSISDIMRFLLKNPKIRNITEKEIVLGYVATDTSSNAFEFDLFMRGHNYHSAIIVTSDYHIARSIVELGALEKKYNIQYIASEKIDFANIGNIHVLFFEYHKLILAFARKKIQEFDQFYNNFITTWGQKIKERYKP